MQENMDQKNSDTDTFYRMFFLEKQDDLWLFSLINDTEFILTSD